MGSGADILMFDIYYIFLTKSSFGCDLGTSLILVVAFRFFRFINVRYYHFTKLNISLLLKIVIIEIKLL